VKALDLCAGAGGLSLGLQRAGFDVLGVEFDPDACATHRANVGPCVEASIVGWHPGREYDLVAGGVPCTDHSIAGQRAGVDGATGALFRDLVRVGVEANARALLVENVQGMTSTRDAAGWTTLARVEEAFRAAGYEPKKMVLCAADYGWIDLCPKHARFADLLSVPSTVQGSAESIFRSGARTPTENALRVAYASAKTITPDIAGNVTSDEWERFLAHRPPESETEPGRAESILTNAAMCVCGLVADTGANTESSPSRCSADHSLLGRSYITAMETSRTTRPRTSKSSPPTPTTCEPTTANGQACPDCVGHGTPQKRYRLLVVGFREPVALAAFRWPAPTHAEDGRLLGLLPWVTVRQALGLGGQGMRLLDPDQPAPTVSRVGELLDAPACTITAEADMGGDKRRPSRRPQPRLASAVLDAPAPTITTAPDETEPRPDDPRTRPQASLRRAIASVLDQPAACVTSGGVGSAGHTGGAEPFANASYRRRLGAELSRVDQPAPVVKENSWLDRAATTVAGDPRVSLPGHHANADHPGHASRGMGARLSLEHRATLQGFPPGFVWHGRTQSSRDKQVGNAVPPQLGEAVGRAVAAALRAADAARDAATQADPPSPIPPASGRV
jgi:site-specific DNA-cytosine methylase